MESFLDSIKTVLWPQRCMFCNDPMFNSKKLTCDRCAGGLPYVTGKVCSKCGRGRSECTCSSATLYYDKAAASFYFEKDVKKCIHSFKFHGRSEFAEPLGEYLTDSFKDHFSDECFDFITSVPLHKDDLKFRGYNQGSLLAERVSRNVGVPFKDGILKKIYHTEKQSGTSPVERFGNVFGVFEVNKEVDLSGMRILLIDDIETTGSTLSECGKMLFLAGADRVCCLSVAVTKLKKKGRD